MKLHRCGGKYHPAAGGDCAGACRAAPGVGAASDTIEITLACGARVSLRGEVSPEMLRQVIELLR